MKIQATICNLLPISKRKIVFYSVTERYAGDGKYLLETFLKLKIRCNLVWVSEREKVETPSGVRSVCGRLAMYRELATAHVIIADGRLDKYWLKGFIHKPGQVYIQIGHEGGLGPSKIGADIHDFNIRKLKSSKLDAAQTDIIISGSKAESEKLISSCYYCVPPTEFGTPSNDVLLRPDNLPKRIREELKIDPEKKVALYIPIQREWKGAKQYTPPNYTKILSALQKRFEGEWIILVRRPPNLGSKGMKWLLPATEDVAIRDVWNHPDTTELLTIADVLISDYANCAFDYLLTHKPCFLYAPDEKRYNDHRGLYFPLDESPMSVAHSNDELLEAIKGFQETSYAQSVCAFINARGVVTHGQSCTKIVDWVENKILPQLLPSQGKIRREIGKSTFSSVLKVFFSSKKLNQDFIRYRILGIPHIALAPTVPLHNPFGNLPIESRKIVFRTALRGFSCNPKYIVKEIIRRNLSYDLVWCIAPTDKRFFNNLEQFPPELKLVVSGTEEAQREISTAKIWFNSYERVADYRTGLIKKEGQIYIQLWHGSFGIKANPIDPIREKWGRISEGQIDYLIANSQFEADHVFVPMFSFGKDIRSKILMYGHPRNDLFYGKEVETLKFEIKEKVGVTEGKRVAFYAPTWRDDFSLAWNNLNYSLLCESLQRKFGGEWVVLTRFHQKLYSYHSPVNEHKNNVIDVFNYSDMQELMLIADVFVSDYSSCICDFMLTKRPIFLYAPDYSNYEVKTRGLLYPLEQTPCPVARNDSELAAIIASFDQREYSRKINSFLEKVGCIEDGHAAERVVNLIEKLITKGR